MFCSVLATTTDSSQCIQHKHIAYIRAILIMHGNLPDGPNEAVTLIENVQGFFLVRKIEEGNI